MTLKILFKSGAWLMVTDVTEWTFDLFEGGSGIKYIKIVQSNPKERLIIKSIDMASIDAIVEVK